MSFVEFYKEKEKVLEPKATMVPLGFKDFLGPLKKGPIPRANQRMLSVRLPEKVHANIKQTAKNHKLTIDQLVESLFHKVYGRSK